MNASPPTSTSCFSGAYNLGFVSMADRPDVHALLDWWDRSLRRDCIIDHSHGRFVDQRFMDLALGFVDDHFVLRDPGYNVAYWNLSQRELQRNGDGITVSGHPLRFFHYSGYDPRRPLRISRHQSRLTFDDVPVVAELYANYAAALRAEGFTEQARLPYAYDRTPAGLVLDLPLRRLLRSAFVDGELPDTLDAFSPDGDAQLMAWLNEPASDGPLAGIPRVLAWVAGQRDDLTRLFGHDPAGLVQWAREYGVREEPALTHVLDAWPVAAPASGAPGEPEPGSTGVDTPPPPRPARRHPWGVNVAGFMRAELGIGEAARQALAALDEAGIPALPVEGRYVPSSRQAADVQVRPSADAPYAINLVCVSPDVLEQWVAGVEPGVLRRPTHDRLLVVGGRADPRPVPRVVRSGRRDLVRVALRPGHVRRGHIQARDPGDDPGGRARAAAPDPRAADGPRAISCSCSCSTSTRCWSARTRSVWSRPSRARSLPGTARRC